MKRLLRALNVIDDEELVGASDVGFAANMQILRTLRVLRLIKLIRLVRASRVFERWKSKITISYSSSVVLQCIFTLVIGSHWYACVIALQASLHTSPVETMLGPGMYGFCSGETSKGDVELGTGRRQLVPDALWTELGFDGSGGILGAAMRGRLMQQATAVRPGEGGPLAGCREMSLGSWYLASFSWSTMVLTGTGGTVSAAVVDMPLE